MKWRVSWILSDGTAHYLEFDLEGSAKDCLAIVKELQTCFVLMEII